MRHKNQNILRAKLRSYIYGLFCMGNLFLSIQVIALPEHVNELKTLEELQANLDLQKDWIKYRFEKTSYDCYSKFFVSSCLKQAKQIFNTEMREIRGQEIPMHERQRKLNEILKDERDIARLAEKLDPKNAEERAKNRRVYDQKQEDREQRIRDLEDRRKDAQKRATGNRQASPF